MNTKTQNWIQILKNNSHLYDKIWVHIYHFIIKLGLKKFSKQFLSYHLKSFILFNENIGKNLRFKLWM